MKLQIPDGSALWVAMGGAVLLRVAVMSCTFLLMPGVAAAQDVAKTDNDRTVKSPCETTHDPDLICFPNHPGTWKETDDLRGANAGQRLLLSKVQGVAATLRRLRVFNPPLGFSAQVNVDQNGERSEAAPYYGRLWLRFHWFGPGQNGEPAIGGEWYKDVVFSFNPSGLGADRLKVRLPDGRPVDWVPKAWGHIGRVTLYASQPVRDYLFIVLANGRRPPWLPVSREQYLAARIRNLKDEDASGGVDETIAEKTAEVRRIRENFPAEPSQDDRDALREAQEDLAQLKKQKAEMEAEKAANGDPVLDPLRAQLRRMSADERASQAWLKRKDGELEPAGVGQPLVAFNPDYYDKARPRSDIQMIVVGFTFGGEDLHDIPPPFEDASQVSRHRLWEFLREVDWRQMSNLVQ